FYTPLLFSRHFLSLPLSPRVAQQCDRSPSSDGSATQAEPISRGYLRVASVSPSQPDQPPPRGRPELAEKSCFPTEAVDVRGIHHRATHNLSFKSVGVDYLNV
ncbi:hypothetical protein Prudu_006483, partial [Prunus dulcis]